MEANPEVDNSIQRSRVKRMETRAGIFSEPEDRGTKINRKMEVSQTKS